MFKLGERIIYGSEGVFIVSDYSSSPVDKNDGRVFYILKSAFGNDNNIIYTPTDNTNVIMRSVMSREQAACFIDRIPDIAPLVVEHEKMRRECYRAVMACAESEGYVSLIKAVQERRAQYAKQKKRASDVDVDYEKKAKYCLYGELSSALDIPFADVEKYISNKIN